MIRIRRLENLERMWPRRRSLAELAGEAQCLARLTGMTFETAFDRLFDRVTDDERPQMMAELEAVLGRDQVDALKAELLASDPTLRPATLPAEPGAL
jgi:hypothetical protein